MAEFLTGDALTEQIRITIGGNGVKCAVAYWGSHHFFDGLENHANWKILCDIQMGSTSPNALRELGAPDNPDLKFMNGLHAKVYLSDEGVVVGSANASSGGLGFDERPARLLEAGTFHKPQGRVWNDASFWFDEMFEEASIVDQAALYEAERKFRLPLYLYPRGEISVLQQIAENPEYFSKNGICFVICRSSADENERRIAAIEVSENEIDAEVFLEWDRERSFIEWPTNDMNNLNINFVEFYFGPRGGNRSVLHHSLMHRFYDTAGDGLGHFYTGAPNFSFTLPSGALFPNALTAEEWDVLINIGNNKIANRESVVLQASVFAELLREDQL